MLSGNDKHELANRLPQFREMAVSAREWAQRATAEKTRRDYQALADSWDQLIKEIESG
jgi:hypothetical protein